MIGETLARRYATAVFSLARDRDAIDRVGQDLVAIARAIRADSVVAAFFVAPIVDRQEKERVLLAAFDGRVDEIALHTLLLLVRKHRETLLDALVAEYGKLQLGARGVEPLQLSSARPLASGELAATIAQLERLYGKKFEVTQVVDPSLLGGVRILMGDRRIDGTVSGRLEALARTLLASN